MQHLASQSCLVPCSLFVHKGSALSRTTSPLFSKLSDSRCCEMLLLHISLPAAVLRCCVAGPGVSQSPLRPLLCLGSKILLRSSAVLPHGFHAWVLCSPGPSAVVLRTACSLQFCLLYSVVLALLYPSHVFCPPFCGLGRPSLLLCDEKSLVITDNTRKSFLCFRRLE